MSSARFAVNATTYGTEVAASSRTSSTSRPVIFVPRDQMYYHSRAWQREEKKAVAEIASGETVRFDSADAAIGWLLDQD